VKSYKPENGEGNLLAEKTYCLVTKGDEGETGKKVGGEGGQAHWQKPAKGPREER